MEAGDQARTVLLAVSVSTFHCMEEAHHTSPTAIFGKLRKTFLNGKIQGSDAKVC